MHGEEMTKITVHNPNCIEGHIAADGRLATRAGFSEVEIRQGISCTARWSEFFFHPLEDQWGPKIETKLSGAGFTHTAGALTADMCF